MFLCSMLKYKFFSDRVNDFPGTLGKFFIFPAKHFFLKFLKKSRSNVFYNICSVSNRTVLNVCNKPF